MTDESKPKVEPCPFQPCDAEIRQIDTGDGPLVQHHDGDRYRCPLQGMFFIAEDWGRLAFARSRPAVAAGCLTHGKSGCGLGEATCRAVAAGDVWKDAVTCDGCGLEIICRGGSAQVEVGPMANPDGEVLCGACYEDRFPWRTAPPSSDPAPGYEPPMDMMPFKARESDPAPAFAAVFDGLAKAADIMDLPAPAPELEHQQDGPHYCNTCDRVFRYAAPRETAGAVAPDGEKEARDGSTSPQQRRL